MCHPCLSGSRAALELIGHALACSLISLVRDQVIELLRSFKRAKFELIGHELTYSRFSLCRAWALNCPETFPELSRQGVIQAFIFQS